VQLAFGYLDINILVGGRHVYGDGILKKARVNKLYITQDYTLVTSRDERTALQERQGYFLGILEDGLESTHVKKGKEQIDIDEGLKAYYYHHRGYGNLF
jgi:hypothetical protein